MNTFQKVKDQMNFEVELPVQPKRVISLVPSQTELLFEMGLKEVLVGRTKFCIHPSDKVTAVEVIGGTKKFNFEKIDQLCPDLIIGNKEENYEEGIQRLKKKYPVWMSDINDLPSAYDMIRSVGEIFQKEAYAEELISKTKSSFNQLARIKNMRAIYFIWNKPKMVAGKNTFINHMMEQAGFINIINEPRYPQLSIETIKSLVPEVVMLSSEPYPYKEEHIKEYEQLFPKARVIIVDGELFSWYGSRLLKSATYFNQLALALDQPS